MVRARLQRLEIGSGGIATIEHQGDIFALLGQLLAAAEQRLGEAGEQRGVILVSRIRVGEQWNVVVAAHQECQAQDPQIGAFALRAAALCQCADGAAVDERIEVGRIKDQQPQIDPVAVDHPCGELLLNRTDGSAVEHVHMIPEALTGQRALRRGEQPVQDRAPIPVVQRSLTGSGYTAVQCRQQQVLPAGQSLVSLGHLGIDEAHHIQLLGDLPERGQRTELNDPRLCRLRGRFAEALE